MTIKTTNKFSPEVREYEVNAAGGALRLEDSEEGRSALDVLDGLGKRPGCPYVLQAARSDGPFGGIPP